MHVYYNIINLQLKRQNSFGSLAPQSHLKVTVVIMVKVKFMCN